MYNGGVFPKLYLKEYADSVRGVHTKRKLAKMKL